MFLWLIHGLTQKDQLLLLKLHCQTNNFQLLQGKVEKVGVQVPSSQHHLVIKTLHLMNTHLLNIIPFINFIIFSSPLILCMIVYRPPNDNLLIF